MTEPSPNAGVSPPVVIRSANLADAPVLARLRYEFRAALDTPRENEDAFVARCEEWMAKRLATGAWWAWVAESHGSAIGTVWLTRVEKIPNPVGESEAHGYLTNFYVGAESRGAGIGTRLLATALEAAQTRGMRTVILWPTPRSRSLYERHGFAVRDEVLVRRTGASDHGTNHPRGAGV